MNSAELYQILENMNLKGYFNVLAFDQFLHLNLEDVDLPSCLIVNTRKMNHRGIHWFSLYITEDYIAYMNSLFCSPKICKPLFNKLTKLGKTINYLDSRIQSTKTSSCGQFCLVFLKFMIDENNFDKFASLFKYDEFMFNENVVTNMYKSYFM